MLIIGRSMSSPCSEQGSCPEFRTYVFANRPSQPSDAMAKESQGRSRS